MRLSPEDREVLQDLIVTAVEGGFLSKEEVLEAATDWLLDEEHSYDDYEAYAEPLVEEAWQKQMAWQGTWGYDTHCDRLSEAFAELDQNGIIARENWWCCQGHGHDAMLVHIPEIEELRGTKVRGWVFYHSQDVEHAIKNGEMYLAHGCTSENEKDWRGVADDIYKTLQRHGLEVTWSKKIQERLKLSNLNWQRRRIEDLL